MENISLEIIFRWTNCKLCNAGAGRVAASHSFTEEMIFCNVSQSAQFSRSSEGGNVCLVNTEPGQPRVGSVNARFIRVRGQVRSSGGDLTSDLRADKHKPSQGYDLSPLSSPVSPQWSVGSGSCRDWPATTYTTQCSLWVICCLLKYFRRDGNSCNNTTLISLSLSLSLLEPHSSIPLTPPDPVLDTASWPRYCVSVQSPQSKVSIQYEQGWNNSRIISPTPLFTWSLPKQHSQK